MGSLYSAAFSRFPPDWRQCRIDGVRCGHNTMVSAARWRVARQQPRTRFGSRRASRKLAGYSSYESKAGRRAGRTDPKRTFENVWVGSDPPAPAAQQQHWGSAGLDAIDATQGRNDA